MDQNTILSAIKELKEKNKKNFKQTFDLIISLKDLDLKKPEQQVDIFCQLHHPKGKKTTTCALIGPELIEQAKTNCDFFIVADDFEKYGRDPKSVKKLSEKYDYFIAQANIMAKIASAFGKVLGRRGKMPNPKAGCVVPPNANLKPLVDKLQSTVRLSARTALMIQAVVGIEDTPEEHLVNNINAIYDAVIHHTPKGEHNIRKVLLKLTMSKPIKIG